MPEKPHAKLKCPYCQSELDLTVNNWLHCRRCRHDIMLASPEKQQGLCCLILFLLPFLVVILIYAVILFR